MDSNDTMMSGRDLTSFLLKSELNRIKEHSHWDLIDPAIEGSPLRAAVIN